MKISGGNALVKSLIQHDIKHKKEALSPPTVTPKKFIKEEIKIIIENWNSAS